MKVLCLCFWGMSYFSNPVQSYAFRVKPPSVFDKNQSKIYDFNEKWYAFTFFQVKLLAN